MLAIIAEIDFTALYINLIKTIKVSMNFFTVYLLYGEWKFGNYICDEMD